MAEERSWASPPIRGSSNLFCRWRMSRPARSSIFVSSSQGGMSVRSLRCAGRRRETSIVAILAFASGLAPTNTRNSGAFRSPNSRLIGWDDPPISADEPFNDQLSL